MENETYRLRLRSFRTAGAVCRLRLRGGGWKEHYDLGMKYLEEGNYEEAIVEFTKAIKIDAKQSIVYIGRGRAYEGLGKEAEKKGNLKEAKKQYEKALDDYEMAESYGNSEATKRISDVKQKLETIEQQIREQESLRAEQENEAELADGEMNAEDAENAGEEMDETGNTPTATQRNTQANTGTSSRNTSNRGNAGNSTGSTGNRNSGSAQATGGNAANSGNTGNTGATGGNIASGGNTGNSGAASGNAASPQTTVTPETEKPSVSTEANVVNEAWEFYENTEQEVIEKFGTGYQLKRNKFIDEVTNFPNPMKDSFQELYYEDLGIGFRLYPDQRENYSVRRTYQIVVYKNIEFRHGLQGGLTYPELEKSIDGRFFEFDGWGFEESLKTTDIHILSLEPTDREEEFQRHLSYEWEGDPNTTPGALVIPGTYII